MFSNLPPWLGDLGPFPSSLRTVHNGVTPLSCVEMSHVSNTTHSGAKPHFSQKSCGGGTRSVSSNIKASKVALHS